MPVGSSDGETGNWGMVMSVWVWTAIGAGLIAFLAFAWATK
jgi:hypothetical protein